MDQTSSKSVFKSKTVWGGAILAATSFVHSHTGVNVADQVQVAEAALSAIYADLLQIAQPVGALIGAVLVVYGRIRATQAISLKPAAAPAPVLSSSPIAKASSVAAAATLVLVLGLTGCSLPSGGSGGGTSSGGSATTTSSTTLNAANVETVLNTAANIIEQLNTTALSVAPTAETVLTMLHNQGDSQVLANAASSDAALTPAITTLVSNVQNAISSAQASGTAGTPAQQAAVSAAISPAAVSQIVAPIAAATQSTASF